MTRRTGLMLLAILLVVAGALAWTLGRAAHLRREAILEASLFKEEGDRAMFAAWAHLTMGMDVRFVARTHEAPRLREDRDERGQRRRSLDLPVDLSVREAIPLLRGLQIHTYGGHLPPFAALRQVRRALEAASCRWVHRCPSHDLAADLPNLEGAEPLPPGNLRDTLELALMKACFEQGLRDLAREMTTFTREDFLRMDPRDQQEYADLQYRLEAQPMLLRHVVGMDALVQELTAARTEGSRERIAEVERRALFCIQETLGNYPWQRSLMGSDNFAPAQLLRSRATLCLSKVYLATAFLLELGIATKTVAIPRHVAMTVTLANGQHLFADPTCNAICPLPKEHQAVGAYAFLPDLELNESYRHSGIQPILRLHDPTLALMAEMLASWGMDTHLNWTFTTRDRTDRLEDLHGAEHCLRTALRLTPEHGYAWRTLGEIREALGDSREAIQAHTRAIACNPLDGRSSEHLVTLWKAKGERTKAEAEEKRLQEAAARWGIPVR